MILSEETEIIAKELILFPKKYKSVEILTNGYIIHHNGKTYEVKVTEKKKK